MIEYQAVCNTSSHDVITARVDGDSVELVARSYGEHKMETYLDTDKARTFARGILALADEIDGGEMEKPEPADEPVKVGTRVRVLKAYGLPQATGELGTVWAPSDQPGRIRVHMDNPSACAVGDKLYADRWEIAGEPTPFASHVEEAKRLLAGTDHTGADVVRLAEILAQQ